MERISFINGQFLPHSQCFVHIEDRGFQFADGVYEVILFKNQKLIDGDWHFERLARSLSEFSIKIDCDQNYLQKIILELFAKNNLEQGSVYLQVTRGSLPRGQGLAKEYSPTIVATVSPLTDNKGDGISVVTHQDIRWQRCDIKSTALMASSMIKQKALDAGVDDAILIRDGYVTEASFANVFIVDQQNNLITRDVDNFVLAGVTRRRIIELSRKSKVESRKLENATETNIIIEERKFTLEEMLAAKEVFLSSTTLLIRPVLNIDGQVISNGRVGEMSRKLFDLYQKFINS